MDNYCLNNTVELTEDFLESTSDLPYGGEVDYGDGDHTRGSGFSRLRYIQMFAPPISIGGRPAIPGHARHWPDYREECDLDGAT